MELPTDEPELTRVEREALGSLTAIDAPSQALEDQVVNRLRSLGLIRPTPWRMRVLGIIALVATGITMFSIGQHVGTPRAILADERTPHAEFLFLLYEGADFDPGTPEQALTRVQEYRTWARRLSDTGHLISAGRLSTPAEAILVPSSIVKAPSTSEPTGYFLVVALDRNEATRLAATCPHVRHGGIVVIRPVA
jgi:hypothetical protein